LKRAVEVPHPPLSIDRTRRDLVRQIADGIRVAIHSGRLPPKARVPPTRALARLLGVSRQVVVAAYEDLAATEDLCGRVGAGSYVADANRRLWARTPARAVTDPDGHTIAIWPIR
jgi:GntR family transcriptional regulator / MocR family aminotransferase